MTDKTPQNKAKTPTKSVKKKDAGVNREPESTSLPDTDPDALKERFKAGSIPLQTDFEEVIDLANVGYQAVGGAEGQAEPANGFIISPEGRLELKPNGNKGISVDQNGVAVKIGIGLKMSPSGLVELNVNSHSYASSEGETGLSPLHLNSTTDVLVIDLHTGLINTPQGVAVNAKDGLISELAGLRAKAGNGIVVNSDGINVKLATNSGLSADMSNGLKIDSEQMFKKGMVMMFAGTINDMPEGWLMCDGNNGTPDLRDRFVMGSTGFTNVNKSNNKKVTGADTDKSYMAASDSKQTDVRVTINYHTLTVSQIPAHKHGIYSAGNEGSGGQALYERDGRSPSYKTGFTKDVGGNAGHNHGASVTQSSHNHSVNVVPPYYILAFIMKD